LKTIDSQLAYIHTHAHIHTIDSQLAYTHTHAHIHTIDSQLAYIHTPAHIHTIDSQLALVHPQVYWQNFSKVSFIVVVCGKLSNELTFENFISGLWPIAATSPCSKFSELSLRLKSL